jgi:hypothetical protein
MKARAVFFLFLFAAGGVLAATPRLEPGLWHLKTVITNNGVAEPVEEEKLCVTPEELADLDVYFAISSEGLPGKCTSSRVPTTAGNTMGFRLRCAGPGFTTDLRATVTIESPRSYRLDGRADARQGGKPIVAITRAQARRLGPCPES